MADQENRNQPSGCFNPAGLLYGAGIGLCYGTALDNMGLGLCLGMGIGLCFCVALGRRSGPSGKKDQTSEEDK